MKKLLIVLSLTFAVWMPGLAQRRGGAQGSDSAPPPLARTDAERRILSVLDEIRTAGRTYLSVPMTDGRVLRLLTEAVNAKSVVEIGTSTGYSGLWFCLALQNTGGTLTTFEFDSGRAATARKHFQQAGVDRLVTVVEGDAHEKIKDLKGPVDVVFIDADKPGYPDYLEKVLPLVRPGGLILAHNVNPSMAGEGYVKQVTSNPDLETIFYLEGGGLSVTIKKR
ncbi:MAG: O-methyltransferase [Acidobacteriia bacterium]|nr:O-methyltransferase [Terriglobia bacterium]